MDALQEQVARVETRQCHLADLDRKRRELEQETEAAQRAYESSQWDLYVLRHHPTVIQHYLSEALDTVIIPPLLRVISEYVSVAGDRLRVCPLPRPETLEREFAYCVTGDIMGFRFNGYVKNHTAVHQTFLDCYTSCQMHFWATEEIPASLRIGWTCTVPSVGSLCSAVPAAAIGTLHQYAHKTSSSIRSQFLKPPPTVTFDAVILEFVFELSS